MRLITHLLPVILLLAAEGSIGAEVPDPKAGTEPQAESGTDNTPTPEPAPPQASPPEANNLRERALGEAFRTFRPSEEISADNAVPFPVDI